MKQLRVVLSVVIASRGVRRRQAELQSRASCVRLVRHENRPARPASDWSVMRIDLRVPRPIGPS
eukprot:8011156-Pyramimonas_sp.AAC.1